MLTDTTFAASQMRRDSVRLPSLAILGGLILAVIVFALCGPFGAANRFAVVLLLGSIALLGTQLVMTLTSPDEQPAFFMYLTYMLFYYLIPGVAHVGEGYFPFYDMQYPAPLIQKAASIVPIFLVAVAIGYSLPARTRNLQVSVLSGRFQFGAIGAAVGALAIGTALGLENFQISRGEFDLIAGDTSNPVMILAMGAARALAFLSLLYAAVSLFRRFDLLSVVASLSGLVAVILILNPFAIARYALASYMLSTVIVFRRLTPRIKLLLLAILVGGSLTVFPLMSALQRGGSTDLKAILDNITRSGDFDGFQSTINVVTYADEAGLQWGYNLFSALFAFVPRAMWPSKGQGAGPEAASFMGYDFVNISSPLPSEFYLDFGYVGVILGGIAIGWLFHYLDRVVQDFRKQDVRAALVPAVCFISFIFIFLRGPLIGVFSALSLSVIIAWAISRFSLRIRRVI